VSSQLAHNYSELFNGTPAERTAKCFCRTNARLREALQSLPWNGDVEENILIGARRVLSVRYGSGHACLFVDLPSPRQRFCDSGQATGSELLCRNAWKKDRSLELAGWRDQ
jgi:hypothetical protein